MELVFVEYYLVSVIEFYGLIGLRAADTRERDLNLCPF